MLRRDMTPDEAMVAEAQAITDVEFDIVLKPISHPELDDICIDGDLFAIGRTETPFASYAADVVADLSRRHAKIFAEHGAVYVADLGSKNGTTVNRVDVRQKTSRLQDGDEICFGGALCYRVQLRMRTETPARGAKLLSLTLVPELADLGLEPIVVTHFPFMVSKSETTFSRYKDEQPHQVNYLSRRHAHIFLKGGMPFVEDLGSTNGTFVNGARLAEHAVALQDGDVLAFGGHHFVYKVGLQTEEFQIDPTVTKLSPSVRGAAPPPAGDRDKTTFVAAADSFLDIFCVDPPPPQDDEVNSEEVKQQPEGNDTDKDGKQRRRGKFATLVSELASAFLGDDAGSIKRGLLWGAALVAVLGVIVAIVYFAGASGRDLKELVESGEYVRAATIANEQLEREPDNAELKALSTEALMKAHVPAWLRMLQERDFKRANATLAGMREAASHNADAPPVMNELAWVGDIEAFVMGRGGPEAPIRIYADEVKIKALLKRWNDDSQSLQQSFAAISSYVPAFKDTYADALSHVRKLQSDDAVYLPAMERLKAGVVAELNRDQPEALDAVINEYAEKYPRIGGLDGVRQDLRQYIALQQAASDGGLGPLVALQRKVRFSTPPFQEKFQALVASGRLPPADIVGQYESVSNAWRAGDAQQAFSGLQKMAAGPWAGAAATELERKKKIADQFAELQKTRAGKGYDERLLAFYGSLDPVEDAYFIGATRDDVALVKDKALKQAEEMASRAQVLWNRYRENGAIVGAQRLEGAVSNVFRTQAGLLTEAQQNAQQGMLIHTQLKLDYPVQWKKTFDEVNTEAELQRKSLLELRNVLEPGLLKAKLALLGGGSDEERKPSKTAR
jgi:pSer/pThr/pTyr-binding forkhead associated (FHA) protein